MPSPRQGTPNPTHRPLYRLLQGRLILARGQAGMTQAQVADALGLSRSKVARIESGRTRIDPVDLLELSILYGKAVEYFLPSIRQVLKGNRHLRTALRMLKPEEEAALFEGFEPDADI